MLFESNVSDGARQQRGSSEHSVPLFQFTAQVYGCLRTHFCAFVCIFWDQHGYGVCQREHIFWSTFLSGLVEVPSAFLGWILSETELLGRRWSTLIMQIISGICIVVVSFIPKSNLAWLKTVVAVFGLGIRLLLFG